LSVIIGSVDQLRGEWRRRRETGNEVAGTSEVLFRSNFGYITFSSPEATILLVSTENHDQARDRDFQC